MATKKKKAKRAPAKAASKRKAAKTTKSAAKKKTATRAKTKRKPVKKAVKKTVIGAGHGDKGQIRAMVKWLLPRASPDSADAADALAIAITHAHSRSWRRFAASVSLVTRTAP